MTVLGVSLDPAVLLQGLIVGIPYGLLAVGLVLIYKVSKFINFAQGAIGAFGGAIVGTLVVSYGVPYWAAFVIGVAFAAGVAAATEAAIVRRLSGQPRLMGVVITLLLAQFLLGLSFAVNTDAAFGPVYPVPAGFPSFEFDTLVVVPSYTALMILGPIVVIAVVILLKRTRFGLAIRATASNPDAAWTAGVNPTKISGRTWALAGAIAAFSAILLWPTQGVDALGTLGPSLMLRGLVAASIARFERVGVAFIAGIAIGLVDTVVRNNWTTSGLTDVILTVIALIVLLARPPKADRESADDGNWTKLSLRPLNPAYSDLWFGRNFGIVMGVAWVVLLATAVPYFFLDNRSAFDATQVFAIGIVGMSVLVLTGRAGQLSLGQFAIAGCSAVVSIKVVASTQVFFLGPLAAMATGAVICLILGLPALRSKGLVLAITTLAFALAARSWILPQEWALSDQGLAADQPVLGALALDTAIEYYFFALVVLSAAAAFTLWFIRSRVGRELVALRDNEGAARALGVPAVRRKVQAFMVAGALAGLGGSLLAHSRSLVTPTDFAATESITIVVIAVVGGIAVVSGPVIGAFLVIGVPALAGLDSLLAAGLQFGLLILILFRPSGFISLLVPFRDWWVEEWGRRYGRDPAQLPRRDAPRKSPFAHAWSLESLAVGHSGDPVAGTQVLVLEGVGKAYGGLRAVDSVDLEVQAGEAVAVIGPNGAGKTTLFEIASGFVRPDHGKVVLKGADVTRKAPETRSREGLVRSFQNALLFPTLTVEETVQMALGRSHAGKRAPAVADVLETAGLTAYADSTIATLPTGVRRMTELACDLALAPQILLLDEPSAGIAHTEIPGLVTLLRQMRESLGLTLVIIDHDMNLLRGVCDRFVAMELGQVIARGTADEVASDPRVIEAFLGGNAAAVERSSASVVASAPAGS